MFTRLKKRFSHPGSKNKTDRPTAPSPSSINFNSYLNRDHTRGFQTLIARAQRERAIQIRKRSISVDREDRRSTTKTQNQSPLFAKLPVELRIKIYEMVLCETGQVNIIESWNRHDPSRFYGRTCLVPVVYCRELARGKRCTVQSNILFTCRRIYREAIDILYSGNAFIFWDRDNFILFSKTLVPHRLRKIRVICVQEFDPCWRPRFQSFRGSEFWPLAFPDDLVSE
ncbi:hypothetical protein BU26DRAFT_248751 [Trematosphaeria pertusa]|uniref:DUF7730 domain-containing protein n=1 Tax=Trematosphaeria pertusa TaxID=390896 RepID=A0A6A6IR11_9PLEO|nr:uncharacterized protein BU26DRAFT_248751 [Trematosphaeria pertusa]KAF2252020.1 hypothetical protein BU26DRAFT_248751 [Trematosphaeria pertusa]